MNKAFQALADPTRRTILKNLNKGEMTAGQIADCFDMSKPSITHHLNILKNADLIQSEKRGQFVVYTLNTMTIQKLLNDYFSMFYK